MTRQTNNASMEEHQRKQKRNRHQHRIAGGPTTGLSGSAMREHDAHSAWRIAGIDIAWAGARQIKNVVTNAPCRRAHNSNKAWASNMAKRDDAHEQTNARHRASRIKRRCLISLRNKRRSRQTLKITSRKRRQMSPMSLPSRTLALAATRYARHATRHLWHHFGAYMTHIIGAQARHTVATGMRAQMLGHWRANGWAAWLKK